MNRDELVIAISEAGRRHDACVFAGNGNVARAFSTLCDSALAFYMVGSMGLCASIAAGFSSRCAMPVISVEGDANLLMGLSALPAVASATRGHRFVHVVADNGICETTGGQRTLSNEVDILGFARAAGYDRTSHVTDADGLENELQRAMVAGGRTMLHAVVTAFESPKHPRVPHAPPKIAERFSLEVQRRSRELGHSEKS